MEEEVKTGVASQYQDTEVQQEGGSRFLNGKDFDGEGQTVEVVSMEVFTPEDPQYAAKNQYGMGGVVTKVNWLVEKGFLQEGQSFKYTFKQNDVVKTFENSSISFFIAFKNVNPAPGEMVSIKRNMKTQTDVEWTINRV